MAFVEDFTAFFNIEEHATNATFDGSAIVGILEAPYAEAFSDEEGVSTSTPSFMCVEADVPDPIGKELIVDGGRYQIEQAQPDGEGITTLILQFLGTSGTYRVLFENGDVRLWENGDARRWEN